MFRAAGTSFSNFPKVKSNTTVRQYCVCMSLLYSYELCEDFNWAVCQSSARNLKPNASFIFFARGDPFRGFSAMDLVRFRYEVRPVSRFNFLCVVRLFVCACVCAFVPRIFVGFIHLFRYTFVIFRLFALILYVYIYVHVYIYVSIYILMHRGL